MKNPKLDKNFLKKLDSVKLKEVYAKIIALNDNDEVLESIEGRVTQGSINIDGASSVRRTCSLTIAAYELNIHQYYWGLHTKFRLSVGVRNEIDSRYPDIIWFDQGVFIISNFTTSQSISNYTISIQGKDKMCKLNGEMGGVITALTWNFGSAKVSDRYGNITEERILIKDIISSAVHQFANEPFYKIIINDLEDMGLELMEYRGKDPFYIFINESTQEPTNMTLDGGLKVFLTDNTSISIKDIPHFNPLFSLESNEVIGEYTKFYMSLADKTLYSVAKLEYGMTAGYRITDLTYAGDLILNVGETITSLLDKIVNMLGDFEYFYDIDGRFIFQRKKTFYNSSWNSIVNNLDEQYVENSAFTSAISYSFEDGLLISSYNNNPNFANIKNDFSVWGTKKSITGKELPVHMRYAIDKKPFLYVNYSGTLYTSFNSTELTSFLQTHYNEKSSFYIKKKNPKGLSEDWWDIFDWAEYYKKCTGEYPNRVMGEYLRNGGVPFTKEELYGMFPKGPRSNEFFLKGPIYLFDVEADGTLGNTGHGTGCTAHKYKDYFIDQLGARGATAYLYKPEMPVDIGDVEINFTSAITDLDWREIIYQMALDFNVNHLREDFHIQMAKQNYNLYTNNKTGYEQYYVDLVEFWRQLYCPLSELQESYEQVYLTRKTYYENPSEYYYATPNYLPVYDEAKGVLEPFHSTMDYFSYQYDEEKDTNILKVVEGLDKYTYEANKELYYYISPEKPTIIQNCIITEPYRISGLGYYNSDGTPIATKVSKTAYENNPEKYYVLVGKEYLPCASVDKYYNKNIYYTLDENNEYKLAADLDQETYEEAPYDYYIKEYEYYQCGEEDVFDKNTYYYIKINNSVIDTVGYSRVKAITEEIFNNNKSMYYTRSKTATYTNCVKIIRTFDPQGEYLVKNIDEESNVEYLPKKISTVDDYNENALYGNLYFAKKNIQPGRHPVDYSASLTFYRRKDSDYLESGWAKSIYNNPESLNFWFDFLDEDSELQRFGCYAIGNRPKAVNDNQIKAIYFRETPTVIFIKESEANTADTSKLGYTYLYLPPNMESLFSVSSQGKSAKTVVDQFIYKHACEANTITISTLPIYHLEPNTRVFVHNEESGIEGEYILTRYSINLAGSGNMSITASKAVDRLY